MDFTDQTVPRDIFAIENQAPKQHISMQKKFVSQSMLLSLLLIPMKIWNTTLIFRKSKFQVCSQVPHGNIC